MKKMKLFVFAAAVAGSYSILASAASTCQMRCFAKYDQCLESGTLPGYKCEQIYETCLRQCGGR